MAVDKLFDDALEEYGESASKHLAFAIVCEHPERGLDGEVSAYALSRNGMNGNILKLASLIMRSCAEDLAKDVGCSSDAAFAKIVGHVLEEAKKEGRQVASGYNSEWPSAGNLGKE